MAPVMGREEEEEDGVQVRSHARYLSTSLPSLRGLSAPP